MLLQIKASDYDWYTDKRDRSRIGISSLLITIFPNNDEYGIRIENRSTQHIRFIKSEKTKAKAKLAAINWLKTNDFFFKITD